MPISDFYLKVTTLPLLQGVSAEQILHMQERGAFRIVSVEPEEGYIIRSGQHCNTLTMLMEGSLMCISAGNEWTLEEEIHAPAVIEEEALWNRSQTYSHTYRPLTNGRLLVADRAHTMQYLMHNEIFRMNLLTRMSSRIERQYMVSTPVETTGVQDKIIKLIQRISYTSNWPKRLKIKMTTLAKLIDETRLNVSLTLRQMQDAEMVTLSREHITFKHIPQ